MKNKYYLEAFMNENNIWYNIPFVVEIGSTLKAKVKIIKAPGKLETVTTPKLKCYYDGAWRDNSPVELIDIIFNENYKIIPPKQKPRDKDEFWYVNREGKIHSAPYYSECTSNIALFLIGNCFKTKNEAEENKEKMVKILNEFVPLINLDEV